MSETQVSNFFVFFSRNHFVEEDFTFQLVASFLRVSVWGGVAPHEGQSETDINSSLDLNSHIWIFFPGIISQKGASFFGSIFNGVIHF